MKHFSNSKSPCCHNAFQVSAPSDSVWEQITIEDFKMADGGHHGYNSDGMSKKCKVTDGHMDEGQTIVNSPWHKLTWSKAQGELTIEALQDGCCGGHRGYRNKMF